MTIRIASPGPSEGSRALDKILRNGGEIADRILAEFNRSQLWRYRTGRRSPDLATAARLHVLTAGAVGVVSWLNPVEPRKGEAPAERPLRKTA